MKRASIFILALAVVGLFAVDAFAAPRGGFGGRGRGLGVRGRAGFRTGRALGVRGFNRGFGGRVGGVGAGAAIVTNDVFLPSVALVPAVAPVIVQRAVPVVVARGFAVRGGAVGVRRGFAVGRGVGYRGAGLRRGFGVRGRGIARGGFRGGRRR